MRDGAALTLLKAWNTGHPGGIATVHSDNAFTALTRLEQLIAEVSQQPMPQVIAEAVDLIVSIERSPEHGRIVRDIVTVSGFRDGTYDIRSAVASQFLNKIPTTDKGLFMSRNFVFLLFLAGAGLYLIEPAFASGGGSLPWEGPLQQIQASINGPVAGAVGLIAVAIAGAMLIFGGELNDLPPPGLRGCRTVPN